MSNSLKVEFYDDFKCIADQCPFTCCRGWEISIDKDTYNRWISEEVRSAGYIKNAKTRKPGEKAEYALKMGSAKCCPLLDKNGLCNIVKECGDDYQPKTCREFPRQENNFGESLSEYSLSCTCPAVVDIIKGLNGRIEFRYIGKEDLTHITPPEYKIRNTMIVIMQKSKLTFKNKVLLIFQMLLSIRKEPVNVEKITDNYQNKEYLLSLIGLWEGIEPDYIDSFQETNELFLDIAMNYRNEKHYSKYLEDIYDLAEETLGDNCLNQWNIYIKEFKKSEKLLENCFVSKIFAN